MEWLEFRKWSIEVELSLKGRQRAVTPEAPRERTRSNVPAWMVRFGELARGGGAFSDAEVPFGR